MYQSKNVLTVTLAALMVTLAGCASAETDHSSSDEAVHEQEQERAEAVVETPTDEVALNESASEVSETESTSEAGTAGATAGAAASSTSGVKSNQQIGREIVLNRMHHINLHEIELANLALEKAQSPKVKSAAEAILSDHKKLESSVASAAQAESVTLAAFQPADYEKVGSDALKTLSGKQFDEAYLHAMTIGHTDAAMSLSLIRKSTSDPKIQALIDGALPTIQSHREMTATLEKEIASAPTQAAGVAADSDSDTDTVSDPGVASDTDIETESSSVESVDVGD